MRLATLSCLLLASSACATVGGLRVEPIDRGDVLYYAVPIATAVAAAQRAIERAGPTIKETSQVDSVTWMIIATTGFSADVFLHPRFGDLVRVAVQQVPRDLVAVRIISRSRDGTEVPVRDWSGPIYRELERDLGPSAVLVLGSRVRVTVGGSPDIVGTLDALTPDELVVRGDRGDSLVAIPTASVGRLAVSRGTRGHARTGAAIGAGVGMVGGYFVGKAAEGECGKNWDFCFGGLTGVFAGGLVGGLIGAAAGSGSRSEEWWDVPLPLRRPAEPPRHE